MTSVSTPKDQAREGANQARHLTVNEPTERAADAIYIHDEDDNDIATFFHSEHATVGQSYETALRLATLLVEANNGGTPSVSPSPADPVREVLEGNAFTGWSTSDLAGQCRMQARENLDPELTAFMFAVADRLAALSVSTPTGEGELRSTLSTDEAYEIFRAASLAFMKRGSHQPLSGRDKCGVEAVLAALAHPPQGGEREREIEAVAEHLHEERDYDRQWTWPTHPKDDGYRGHNHRLTITPPDVQARLREEAGRILTRVDQLRRPAAPLPPSESSGEEALLTVSISVIGEESTSCHLSIAKGVSFTRAEHAVARAIDALKTEYKNRFDCPAFNAEKFAVPNRPSAGHSMSSMSSMSSGEKSAYYGSIVPRVLAQKERDMRAAAPWIKMEIERLRTENAQLKSAALAHPPQEGEEAPTASIAKPDPMIEAGRERAKQCRSENCKDGYCMNWHAPHACWVRNRKGTESSGEEA